MKGEDKEFYMRIIEEEPCVLLSMKNYENCADHRIYVKNCRTSDAIGMIYIGLKKLEKLVLVNYEPKKWEE